MLCSSVTIKGTGQSVELHQVAQHADDLDRAVAFYSDVLGCEFITRIEPPGLAFLRLGSVRLLLDRAAPSALIYLRVDDVRATAEKLRAAGVPIDTEPHLINTDTGGIFGEPGCEEWMAFIRDSEQNLVGLASQHAPAGPPR
jgi:methylmalonyl-CoA/ethylmalonyl-CoA epimerase